MEKNIDISEEIINKKFQALQSKEELLELINQVLALVFPSKFSLKKITSKQFDFYATSYGEKDKRRKRYRVFFIKKKSGSLRQIMAPHKELKYIQSALNIILQCVYEPQPQAYGFVSGRSIADHAALHTGVNFVYNIDLKDFFPSIHFRRIKKMLEQPPFNLNDTKEALAYALSNLCTEDGVLPQGAPTSPVLTNIICQRLDRRLDELARSHNARYSRYADDITFSSNDFIFSKRFKQKLEKIITDERFTINREKTRLQGKAYRQEVTGLTVNEKVNVPRKYMRSYRTLVHLYQSKGPEAAMDYLFKRMPASVKDYLKPNTDIKRIIEGKYYYIKSIKKDEAPEHPFGKTGKSLRVPVYYSEGEEMVVKWLPFDEVWIPLVTLPADNTVNNTSKEVPKEDTHLASILETWDKEGFDKAISLLKNSNGG